MKKLFSILLLLFAIAPNIVFADSIDSIEVNANILDDGSLQITQVWKATADSGTEFYIPMQNLNHMELTDFKVSDENGPYTEVPWDVEASFEEKANKYGINKTVDGIELCFGKTALEPKTYTINYTLKNAVIGYTDLDGFNIRFINHDMDPAPDNVKVTIQKNGVDLNESNAKIWAFGYIGNILFEDGKIVAKNTEPFSNNQNLTILMSLNKGIINPSYTLNDSFETLKSVAFENSSYENDYNDLNGISGDAISQSSKDFSGPVTLIIFFIILMPIFIFFSILVSTSKKRTIAKNINEVDEDHPEYYREAPFNGNLTALLYLRQKEINILNAIISAQILKWVKSGNLSFECTKNSDIPKVKLKSKDNFLKINSIPNTKNGFETNLFEFILKAKGDDDILTPKEFKRFLLKSKDFPYKFLKSIKEEGRNYLIDNGYLEERSSNKYYLTEKGLIETSLLCAFERFLYDLEDEIEKEPMEISKFDDLLIMGVLLGSAEEVIDAFKHFYPEDKYASHTPLYVGPNSLYPHYLYLTSFSKNSYQAYGLSSSSSSASFGGGGGFSGGGTGGGGR